MEEDESIDIGEQILSLCSSINITGASIKDLMDCLQLLNPDFADQIHINLSMLMTASNLLRESNDSD